MKITQPHHVLKAQLSPAHTPVTFTIMLPREAPSNSSTPKRPIAMRVTTERRGRGWDRPYEEKRAPPPVGGEATKLLTAGSWSIFGCDIDGFPSMHRKIRHIGRFGFEKWPKYLYFPWYHPLLTLKRYAFVEELWYVWLKKSDQKYSSCLQLLLGAGPEVENLPFLECSIWWCFCTLQHV